MASFARSQFKVISEEEIAKITHEIEKLTPVYCEQIIPLQKAFLQYGLQDILILHRDNSVIFWNTGIPLHQRGEVVLKINVSDPKVQVTAKSSLQLTEDELGQCVKVDSYKMDDKPDLKHFDLAKNVGWDHIQKGNRERLRGVGIGRTIKTVVHQSMEKNLKNDVVPCPILFADKGSFPRKYNLVYPIYNDKNEVVLGLVFRGSTKDGSWFAPTVLTLGMIINDAYQAEPDMKKWPQWLFNLLNR